MDLGRLPRATLLLIWCLAGAGVVYFILAGPMQPASPRFSAIFWYLLKAYDPLANVLLLVLAVAAFALRDRPAVAAVANLGRHPFALAGVCFFLFCLGSRFIYHARPLSMDEYSALFQAEVFAAGQLAGRFPPDLLDRLVPLPFHKIFLHVSRSTGEVASTYWPGFALIVAPFAWLGVPWAANPAIGALSLPVIHRLTRAASGSDEAAAWAVMLTLASPVFVVSAMSFYAMPAHLLLNAAFALLLLQPTALRALAAGAVGSLALTLHNPLPHLLFALPFMAWLLARRSWAAFASAAAAYLLIALPIGLGWKLYLSAMTSAAASASAGASAASSVLDLLRDQLAIFSFPRVQTLEVRITGLTKAWTWGACALVVLAGWAWWRLRESTPVRLLAAAFVLTVLGYFFIRFDQGHGWGYRYLHSAWFVLPVLGAMAVGAEQDKEFRDMAAWALVLSLVLANALRLVQVESFIDRHLSQVPPLAPTASRVEREVVFVNPRAGFYSVDLVQNDPFLRRGRIIMLGQGTENLDAFMAQRFPGFVKKSSGEWGQHWVK